MLAGLQQLSEFDMTPGEIKAKSVLERLNTLGAKVSVIQLHTVRRYAPRGRSRAVPIRGSLLCRAHSSAWIDGSRCVLLRA